MQFSSVGVFGHHEDITRLLKEDFFTEREKENLVKCAQENFIKRKNSTVKDTGYNYQVVKYNDSTEIEKIYEIVMPLNIAWDAAALDRDDLFEDYLEWIDQTLRYLLNNTDANIMVREHPAQNVSKMRYNYVDLQRKLPVLISYPDRIFFAAADAQVNTYQYIERCKLVLPYTSTLGVEAVMLGKNVILHTNVYYENIGIAYKTKTKEDYFNTISYYLEHPEKRICSDPTNAYLAYYYQMCNGVPSQYCVHHIDWLENTLDEIREISGVSAMLSAVGEGIPTIYSRIKQKEV